MTKETLLQSIVDDLGANYRSEDSLILGALLDETIENALDISNRKQLVSIDENGYYVADSLSNQLIILASEIRRAVKSLYLQRGSEDVSTQSNSGISSTFDNAQKRLRDDIIANGKRLFRI